MIYRKQIISEARSWLGTPFHPQARLKSIGCDCIGLIVGVLKNVGNDLSAFIPPAYDFFRDREYFYQCMHRVFVKSNKSIGSIVICGDSQIGWHAGFLSGQDAQSYLWIHSCMKNQMVVEQRLIENVHKQVFYFQLGNNFHNKKIL